MAADRAAGLRAAATRKRERASARAAAAIRELDQRGTQITFQNVVRHAGVSRQWLYQLPALREEIERLRDRAPAALDASALGAAQQRRVAAPTGSHAARGERCAQDGGTGARRNRPPAPDRSLLLPEGVPESDVRRALLARLGVTFGDGLGRLTDRCLRVGRLGDVDELMVVSRPHRA